ncbi:uncharacterized protein ACRADG_012941 [Cochliomyia hominivorax]
MSPRCRCILCRAENNQGSNSDSSEQQVHRQERTATNCPLRQRDELRRSQSSHEGPSTSIRQQSQSHRIVRSVVRGEVQLHTTSGAPLRRTVGGRSQTGEIPTSARNRKCIFHQRGNGNNARRSRGGAQQSSASTVVSRPERRRGANSSSPIDRRGSAFAAARIRRRRDRQRGEIMQALATALRSQADVLAGMVESLHSGSARQSQMARSQAEHQHRSSGNNPRRQLPAAELADRESRRNRGRRRRQGQSGGGQNQKRRL